MLIALSSSKIHAEHRLGRGAIWGGALPEPSSPVRYFFASQARWLRDI
jgi:hypothetical protein